MFSVKYFAALMLLVSSTLYASEQLGAENNSETLDPNKDQSIASEKLGENVEEYADHVKEVKIEKYVQQSEKINDIRSQKQVLAEYLKLLNLKISIANSESKLRASQARSFAPESNIRAQEIEPVVEYQAPIINDIPKLKIESVEVIEIMLNGSQKFRCRFLVNGELYMADKFQQKFSQFNFRFNESTSVITVSSRVNTVKKSIF